jgi:hypothetical protein
LLKQHATSHDISDSPPHVIICVPSHPSAAQSDRLQGEQIAKRTCDKSRHLRFASSCDHLCSQPSIGTTIRPFALEENKLLKEHPTSHDISDSPPHVFICFPNQHHNQTVCKENKLLKQNTRSFLLKAHTNRSFAL